MEENFYENEYYRRQIVECKEEIKLFKNRNKNRKFTKSQSKRVANVIKGWNELIRYYKKQII